MNLETLYHRRSFFGAFSLHIQSCRQLHSFILRLKSLEKSLSDNIKIIVTTYLNHMKNHYDPRRIEW